MTALSTLIFNLFWWMTPQITGMNVPTYLKSLQVETMTVQDLKQQETSTVIVVDVRTEEEFLDD